MIIRVSHSCTTSSSDILLEYLKVLADLHSAAELKEAAVKFVVEHSEEFVDQVDDAFFYKFSPPQIKVDKFKPYPDLMAELFKAMARSPPTKRRK